MTSEQRQEIETLVSALCDGCIEPQQIEQLEEMLRDSEQCRLIYLQYVDMHARLTVHPNLASGIPLETGTQATDDEVVMELAQKSLGDFLDTAERNRRRRRISIVTRWVAVALLVLVATIGWRVYDWWLTNSELPVVREVVGEVSIERTGDSSLAEVGYRLRRGEQLRLGDDDARAVLEYADGTQVVVYFNLNRRSSVECRRCSASVVGGDDGSRCCATAGQ